MPGGFTWADAFAGYQSAGQLAIDIGAGLVVASFVFGALWCAMWAWRDRQKARLDRITGMDSVRAMAHERVAQHSALPYTDAPVFDDWPETTHRTHRRAS